MRLTSQYSYAVNNGLYFPSKKYKKKKIIKWIWTLHAAICVLTQIRGRTAFSAYFILEHLTTHHPEEAKKMDSWSSDWQDVRAAEGDREQKIWGGSVMYSCSVLICQWDGAKVVNSYWYVGALCWTEMINTFSDREQGQSGQNRRLAPSANHKHFTAVTCHKSCKHQLVVFKCIWYKINKQNNSVQPMREKCGWKFMGSSKVLVELFDCLIIIPLKKQNKQRQDEWTH